MKTDYHSQLLSFVFACRYKEASQILKTMPPHLRLNYIGLALTQMKINYGIGEKDIKGGARFRIHKLSFSSNAPATWKRGKKWGNNPPGLECGFFVELILYMAGITNGYILNYRGLRDVPKSSKLFKEASRWDSNYKVNWVPTKKNSHTIIEDAGLCKAWAMTPHLLYFRREFVPVDIPKVGDLIFMTERNIQDGWSAHVGIWGQDKTGEGIIHSTPIVSKYAVRESGPKFTRLSDPYFTEYLKPQMKKWERWFGSCATRLKEV